MQQVIITNGTIEVDVTGLTFPEAFVKVNEAGIKAGKTSVRTVFNDQGKAMGMERIVRELKTDEPASTMNLGINLMHAFNAGMTGKTITETITATETAIKAKPEPKTKKAEKPEEPKSENTPVEPPLVQEQPKPEAPKTPANDAPADKPLDTPAVVPAPAAAAVVSDVAQPQAANPQPEPAAAPECDIAPDYTWDDAWLAVADGSTLPAIACIGE